MFQSVKTCVSFYILVLLLFTAGILNAAGKNPDNAPPPWKHDRGPLIETSMGRELVDLTAAVPLMPLISKDLMGLQKFRPIFGPVLWRMLMEPNSLKILFIGQDATHIAEAAARTATAAFGGSAQNMAKFMGTRQAAFINAYAFTIKGQYGAFNTPFIYDGENGKEVRFSGFVDNQLWLMSNDPQSPINKFRNALIDWIIRNNRDSLKMIVTFGKAAADAAAGYVESRGGKVGSRWSEKDMQRIQVPVSQSVYAGGNNEFPVPITTEGGDLYAQLLNKTPDYKDLKVQAAAQKALKQNFEAVEGQMVFTRGGPYNNGLIDPRQLGGSDLNKIEINDEVTRSLRGLPLDDGSRIEHDIVVLELPHPSFLSRQPKDVASEIVKQDLKVLDPYIARGWRIEPDEGMVSLFEQGADFPYKKVKKIGDDYYDFGAPATRKVPVSTASRMPKKPHVIIFGVRGKVQFDQREVKRSTNAEPGEEIGENEVFIMRPISEEDRYTFDPGPSEELARLMKENLNLKEIFKPKKGKTWAKNGISAFNVKTHPDVEDFGHYRGTFEKPRVLILADPASADDLITARALTGTRGQFLHGLMRDIGVGDEYLVVKTVPFGMQGATSTEWRKVLDQTQTYRNELLKAVTLGQKFDLILTDGPYAKQELERFQKEVAEISGPIINISRRGESNNSGIMAAGRKIKEMSQFQKAVVSGKLANIPRSHLTFYARIWEGTSGDRIIESQDQSRGLAFAEVAPKWAWTQKLTLDKETTKLVAFLVEKLRDNGFPLPNETIAEFLARQEGKLIEIKPSSASPPRNCNDLLASGA